MKSIYLQLFMQPCLEQILNRALARRAHALAATLVLGLAWALLPIPSNAAASTQVQPAVSWIVTVNPLALLVREVGGPRVAVHVLVPPGASPHTFAPKPSDLRRVANADGFLVVGGGMDDWAHRIVAGIDRPVDVVALVPDEVDSDSHGPGGGGHRDPHVWLDPILVRDEIVPMLVEALGAVDPEGQAEYARRGRAFQQQLDALDDELRAILEAAPLDRFIAFHNAWRHFARRYGLEELAVVQEFAGEEPTPRELADLVRAARRESIPAILVEPQLDARLARTIATEFGGRTLEVDPLGDPNDPRRASYAMLMRFNARAFAEAMGSTRGARGGGGDGR